MLSSEVLKIFEEREELEFVINGTPLISIDDWQEHTNYKDSLSTHDESIQWFWEILATLS